MIKSSLLAPALFLATISREVWATRVLFHLAPELDDGEPMNSRPLHPNKFTHFFLRHASLQAQPFKAIPHGHFITPFLVCVSIISLVDKKDTQKLK